MAAERFGFAQAISPAPAPLRQVWLATDGDGFDVVFDATGYARSMEKAFAFVAHGGALVLVSVVKDDIRFSDPEFHKREMMLIGSRNATRSRFRACRRLDPRRAVPVDRARSPTARRWPARPHDLPRWAHEKSGLIKAVIEVGER